MDDPEIVTAHGGKAVSKCVANVLTGGKVDRLGVNHLPDNALKNRGGTHILIRKFIFAEPELKGREDSSQTGIPRNEEHYRAKQKGLVNILGKH